MDSFQSEKSYSDSWPCISWDQWWIINESYKRWGTAAPGAVLSQSQGASREDHECPQQPAATATLLLPPHTGSVQPLHIYVSCLRVPRKIRKERKMERTKTKRVTAPDLLRLQHISVSMHKSSLLTQHILVYLLQREYFWCVTQILNVKKLHFCFETKYLSSQLILILHLDSNLNSWAWPGCFKPGRSIQKRLQFEVNT